MHLHTVYMEYSACLPTLWKPLAEKTCFSQACVADCAGMFGGDKVFDFCSNCGGDGSSCDGTCPVQWTDMCGVSYAPYSFGTPRV